jgi:hypothetical protein
MNTAPRLSGFTVIARQTLPYNLEMPFGDWNVRLVGSDPVPQRLHVLDLLLFGEIIESGWYVGHWPGRHLVLLDSERLAILTTDPRDCISRGESQERMGAGKRDPGLRRFAPSPGATMLADELTS